MRFCSLAALSRWLSHVTHCWSPGEAFTPTEDMATSRVGVHMGGCGGASATHLEKMSTRAVDTRRSRLFYSSMLCVLHSVVSSQNSQLKSQVGD